MVWCGCGVVWCGVDADIVSERVELPVIGEDLIKSQCFHNDNFDDFVEKRHFRPTLPNRLVRSSYIYFTRKINIFIYTLLVRLTFFRLTFLFILYS